MANTVDSDETALYEPSHLDLQCLQNQRLLCLALYSLTSSIYKFVTLFSSGSAAEGSCVDVSLLFSQFDLEKVLHNGASLLGSEGAQFEKEDKIAGKLT